MNEINFLACELFSLGFIFDQSEMVNVLKASVECIYSVVCFGARDNYLCKKSHEIVAG